MVDFAGYPCISPDLVDVANGAGLRGNKLRTSNRGSIFFLPRRLCLTKTANTTDQNVLVIGERKQNPDEDRMYLLVLSRVFKPNSASVISACPAITLMN